MHLRPTKALLCLLLAPLFLLAACNSEPPPVPPAELRPTSAEVNVLRIWRANVGEAGTGRFEPWIHEDQLVLANRKGKLTSLALGNGMRRWTRELDARLGSGVGGDDGQLYVSDANGVVFAIDASSGETLWTAEASSEILVPVAAGFGVAIVRSADGRVVALDPTDGNERWTVSNTPPALTLNGYSRPLLLDGGVLIGLDDGRLLALGIANGKQIWETIVSVPTGRSEVERLVDLDADVLVDDQGIYVANYQGKAARIEPSRGEIVWSVPMSAGSGIALNSEAMIVIDSDDTVHRLDKESGQILWSNDTMPGRRLSPPAFTPSGNIVVGDVEGYLHVLSFASGETVGRTKVSNTAIKSRPQSHEDTIFVQATDGTVASYRFAR